VVHRRFVSYVATVVEIAMDDKGRLSVPRVDIARAIERRRRTGAPFAPVFVDRCSGT
jgi:hypothetical protein